MKIIGLIGLMLAVSACSLATPSGACDACRDAGRDLLPAADKARPDALPDPDKKKSDPPVTFVDNDKDGYYSDVDCDDNNPNIHPNAKEICNGKDDNCDGLVDNNLTDTGAPCGSNIGECKPGVTACVNGKLECDGAKLPQNELCNGKDDDCDGVIDNGFPDLGKPCDEGIGECKRSGYYICNGSATKLKCDAVPVAPKIEGPPGDPTCFDGLDNDCDGLTDLSDPDCINCKIDADCADNNPCTFDKCVGGACQNKAVADGTLCSDGVYCNGIESCKAGKCVAGQKVVCDDGNSCTKDACDETQKKCVFTPVPVTGKEGTPGSPACLDGLDNDCDGLVDLADPDCQGCNTDLECVDNNPCTNDYCDSSRTCKNVPKTDGASCDDGLYCNGLETCQSGKCVAGTPVACQNNNACFTVKCDESKQGACTATAIAGCKSCQSQADCDDKNSCTSDACVGGKCYSTNLPDNAACDDGAFCTVGDKCLGGICVGTPRDCSGFADACNDASCDESADACKKSSKANGTSCDDALYCNGHESCLGGVCQPGAPVVCNDNNPCTKDACDETQKKCVFTYAGSPGSESWSIAGSCSDGIDNDCDGLIDYADPDCRQCQYNSDCNDFNPCTQDTCNTTTWKCDFAKLNGTACDDGQWCTTNDTCSNGICTGTPRNCSSYGGQCNDGICNESLDICQVTQKANGTLCDDGLYCTIGEYCVNGYCTNGQPRNCNGGTCNEYTDTCDNSGNGPGCADGTREGFIDGTIFPNIAGCSGTWSSPGLSNASFLCAYGWHICNNAGEVASHMPSGKTCWDAWSGSDKRFFATFQPSNGNGYCNTYGTNDIFGCGNYGDPPQPSSCGMLNVFSSEDCNAIKYPYAGAPETWRCGGPGDSSDELVTVVKLQQIGGGVLCCTN